MWGLRQLMDIDDVQARDDLARCSVTAMSFVAQSARGDDLPPVPQSEIDKAQSIPERFVIRWRGEADPAHVKAIDAYWISAAEHGMNASTFTARVVASTGADVGASLSAAVGALSGPLHGGAPSRVLDMLDEVERMGDAERWVKQALDRGERLMGFGHRVYRAEDPRARVLRRTSREVQSPRYEVAEALEKAAIAELAIRKPDRVLQTNVEFWSAVVLDFAKVPANLFTSMFTCARTAGWSAHILEQKRTGRLIRRARGTSARRPARATTYRRPSKPDRSLGDAPTVAEITIPAELLPRTAGSAPGRPRSAPSSSPRSRRPARRCSARRTASPRSRTSSARCATACARCCRCPTTTRCSSATAGRRSSGTSRRSAWCAGAASTSSSASSRPSSPPPPSRRRSSRTRSSSRPTPVRRPRWSSTTRSTSTR
jgi:citrate synthase